MGYYTYHTLDISATAESFLMQCEHINPPEAHFCMTCGKEIQPCDPEDAIWDYINAHEEMIYAFGKNGDGGDNSKWYDLEKDMRELSKLFPNYLFTVHGEGEEAGDLWNKYFLDGKCQTAQAAITYEKFDLTMLS